MQKSYKYFHIAVALSVLLIPIFSSPDFDGSMRMFTVKPFQRDFVRHVLMLVFFYLDFLLLYTQLYQQRKKVLYFLVIFVLYLLICNLPYWIIPNHQEQLIGNRIFQGAFRDDFFLKKYTAFIFSFLFVWLISAFIHTFRQKQAQEVAKIRAELQGLKYQLQPHFFLNTLNNIYSLTLNKSAAASEAVMKLSGIMRYVLSESTQETVSLERELEHITDFVALQLLKTDDHFEFSYNQEGEPGTLRVAPMILINFIENAFKYGINSEAKSTIHIQIFIQENHLELDVFNRKVSKPFGKIMSTKMGMATTLERLKLLYPDKHNLMIDDLEESYRINLKMELI